ncbi:MAG TPA: hypothetical protein VF271_09700 [Rhodanobacteraceae bacterium]
MKRVLLLLLCLALPALAFAGTPQLLQGKDVPALLQPPAHGERVIALWSLDCVYCEPNLAALAKLARQHPHTLQLVVVSTDAPSRQKAVAARLQKMHLAAFTTYVYAEASPERLNYLIDRDWGGELPHTVVIRADGKHFSFSGDGSPAQLRHVADGASNQH